MSLINPVALAIAGPILLLWGASPAIAWWVSRPLARRSAQLTVDQTHFLRKLARKTWAYFETYVGPDDHWLPPDNVQEHPAVKVAHRTSPTNMGLALLANLTAHDFGYLSTGQLVARTTQCAAQHGIAGAVSRALLQLVRHPNATASRSSLCLDGGQRQPRGPSADLATRTHGALRRPHPQPTVARGAERHVRDSGRRRRRGSRRVPSAQFETALESAAAADRSRWPTRGSRWNDWLRAPTMRPHISPPMAPMAPRTRKAKPASGPRRSRGNARTCAMT